MWTRTERFGTPAEADSATLECMAIYQDILDQAGTAVAGGQLHENLWGELLKLEEPGFHNVRLGQGDGGIDGDVLRDPKTGDAEVFQAKFNAVLDDDQRDAIVASFGRVHTNDFRCVRWTLLVPIELSAPELNWLTVTMRTDAIAATGNVDVRASMTACEILFKDRTDLEGLLMRHLDVAGRLLPNSTHALVEQLAQARQNEARLDREIAAGLLELRQEAIRRRSIETARALVAIRDLWLGWADYAAGFAPLARLRDRARADELQTWATNLDGFL